MANINPFRALRPKPELAEIIFELPYDVMSSEEARQIATDNPLSFLNVRKPIPSLYIADGHHRSAAADQVARNRSDAGNSGRFLSVIFPQLESTS